MARKTYTDEFKAQVLDWMQETDSGFKVGKLILLQ